MNSRDFLRKTVTVTIDRPLGSIHPKNPDIVYPLNYGYIEGTVSGDGAPIDAYILGEYEELATFTGFVHAILHRTNDDDDKLIVADESAEVTDDDIREATYFMEQFFESEIWR
jgi:inorganic pyrophosphatase